MAKNQRNIPGQAVRDPSAIYNNTYSEASGAEKNISVGPHLLPLPAGGGNFTTTPTTATMMPSAGKNIAVFNSHTTQVHSITMGEDNTVTAQVAGAIQAGTQHVGIPCTPNDWTYLSCGLQTWIIAESTDLKVFLIDDESSIKIEVK